MDGILSDITPPCKSNGDVRVIQTPYISRTKALLFDSLVYMSDSGYLLFDGSTHNQPIESPADKSRSVYVGLYVCKTDRQTDKNMWKKENVREYL